MAQKVRGLAIPAQQPELETWNPHEGRTGFIKLSSDYSL